MTIVAPEGELLEQAFDGVSDAVVVMGFDGTISRINRAAEALYGLSRDDAVGREIMDLVHPLLPPEETYLITQVVAAGQAWTGEMLARCADLRTRLLHTTNRPLLRNGDVVGIIGISKERPLGGDAARGRSDALVLVDASRHIALWSRTLTERLGDDLAGQTLDDLAARVHPDDQSAFRRLLAGTRSNDADRVSVRIRNDLDGYVAFAVTLNDLRHVPDVAGQVLTLHRVRDNFPGRAMAAAVSPHPLRAVFTLDLRGNIKRWSPGAEHLYGWTAAEITGHSVARLADPDRLDDSDRHLRQALHGRGMKQFDAGHVTKLGIPVDASVTFSAITDEHGTAFEILALVDDAATVGDPAAADRSATIDVLTGLPNRALVYARLRAALGHASRGRGVAVLFVDVDSFKLVNDSLGHSAGDELLAAIGQRLAASVSASDVVGRVGGDEFVVVCGNLPGVPAATAIATRILERISDPLHVSGHEVLPAVSIGIAITDRPDTDAAELLSEADTAMYRAKANGRARYEVFDQELHQSALLRLELEEDLRRALRDRELCVRFQPVVSLDDGTITGVEALVRWDHPERGMLLPSEFLPMATETGLVVPIGRQVIADSCAQLARWRAAGIADISLAINLSSRELAESDLLAYLVEQVELQDLRPESILLELTEDALLTDAVVEPAAMLREFRDAGFRLSIDDFGTGYCSLLYLRHFPVSQLKLDRLFIAGLGRDPQDEAIIQSVLSMARALGLEAVAEGIERPEQRDHLRRLGCHLGQGFLWAPAVGGDEIEMMVELERLDRSSGLRS